MGYSTRASDWQAAAFAQVGGAGGAAGGAFWFMFRSETAGVRDTFEFLGLGIGLGGSAGGGPGAGGLEYSPVNCFREFSVHDLHRSLGELGTAGASVVVGVSRLVIIACDLGGPLFTDSYSGGVSTPVGVGQGVSSGHGVAANGVSLGAMLLRGMWFSMALSARAGRSAGRSLRRALT